MRYRSARAATFIIAGLSVITLTMSACSSSNDSNGGSDAIDCETATAAIEKYSDALTDMVIGLSEGDSSAARSAAEAFGPAAREVTRSLPGLPAEAQDFVTRSEDASRLVVDSLSGGVEDDVILEELNTLFSDDAFTTAGGAIDSVFNGACGSATPRQ
jgi:hypothetical protein